MSAEFSEFSELNVFECNLRDVVLIRGMVLGHEFKSSAYHAAIGTDLKFYRADNQYQRILATVEKVDEEKWMMFTKWSGPGRKDF